MRLLENILPLLIGVCVFIFNISYFGGPAYLQDEIGYLSKAALLVGKVVDGSSSYHGGISMLISPAFLLRDPGDVWIGVLAINAFVFSISIRLIFEISKFFAASTYPPVLRGAVFLSAIYPASWVMSGYIFPSIYLGLFFLMVFWIFLKNNNEVVWGVLPPLFVGFIYWMHPTGIVLCAAFVLTQIVQYRRMGNKSIFSALVLQLCIIGLMVVSYAGWVHPYMNVKMTPAGQLINSHYESYSAQFEKFSSLNAFQGVMQAVFGQLSYLLVSTFGLGFFGLAYLVESSWDLVVKGRPGILGGGGVFMLLSVLGLFAVGGVAMALPSRIDHVVYGRYQEITYALLIFLGFLYCAKKRSEIGGGGVIRFLAALILVIVSIELFFVYFGLVGIEGGNNIVNTIGLYPQYFFQKPNIILWLSVGLVGIFLLLLLGVWSYIPAMLIFSIVTIYTQVAWHKSILAEHSKPSALASLITDFVTPGACVAFDVDGMDEKKLSLRQREQFDVLKFYLLKYQYKRMNFSSWLARCDGPMLTYSPENYIDNRNVVLSAKDVDLGLFMILRVNELHLRNVSRSGVYINNGRNQACLLAGCFDLQADQLLTFSQNGVMNDGYLIEGAGRDGVYLFYGPYNQLGEGAWRVDLELGKFSEGEYVLDVVSGRGSVTHAEKIIDEDEWHNGGVSLFFYLSERVEDLEVRLRVVKAGNVSVKKYVVNRR